MKWKNIFHPKFLSIFIILLLFGIAIAPSINAIKITKPIDNIVNEEIDKDTDSVESKNIEKTFDECNCYNLTKNGLYPPVICLFLAYLIVVPTVVIMNVLMLLMEEGIITPEQGANLYAILSSPLVVLMKLHELLNCPPIPDFPDKNNYNLLDAMPISNKQLNPFLSLLNINAYEKINKNSIGYDDYPISCAILYLQIMFIISKIFVLNEILLKLNVNEEMRQKIVSFYYMLHNLRIYRILDLAGQMNCEWLKDFPPSLSNNSLISKKSSLFFLYL